MTSIESNINNLSALHTQTNSQNMSDPVHVNTVNHSKRFKTDTFNLKNAINNNNTSLIDDNDQYQSLQMPLQELSGSSGSNPGLKKLYIVSDLISDV